MQDVTQIPPRTAMEVFKILPEGTLCEVINGQLFMSPSPLTNHQVVVTDLLTDINSYCKKTKLARVFVAPYDVYLDEEANAVQPDIVVVLEENKNIIKEHIHGVPDMIIEVLSEGNKNHDLVRKKELYERSGVKEYFIIEPESRLTMSFRIKEGKYIKGIEQTGKLTSSLLNKTFEF